MNDNFVTALRQEIKRAIADLDSGTVGISRGCLWQLIALRASRLPHAPSGTSGAWAARRIFDSIVAEPAFSRFVYA